MPQLTRVTAQQVNDSRLFDLAAIVPYEHYSAVKDCWIDRKGMVRYAGYYGHTQSARIMGFNSELDAENKGLIHISSCYNGTPDIVHLPHHITKAQKETLFDYCTAHSINYQLD